MATSRSITPGILRSPPLGTRIPGSVHAITCSIPTMRDVVHYEEKDPATLSLITSGYPRFVTHFYIRRIAAEWTRRFGLEGRQLFITASEPVAREAIVFGADPQAGMVGEEGLFGIHLPADSPAVARIKAYMQHVGGGISSRLAENYLHRHGIITATQHEERADPESAEGEVRLAVGDLFGVPAGHVLLANSGMNAFHSAFRAINDLRKETGHTEWIQLGWLYVDTIEILRKLGGGEHTFLSDVLDLDAVERILLERGDRVAGIVTEMPTNPIMQSTDLVRLRKLTNRFEVPLIVDPSLASPYNIDVLPHCDVAINSLTKYAASGGDVMMGAAVVNPDSPWAGEILTRTEQRLIPPFLGDLRRIAVEIRDYASVMDRINFNTVALTAFLEKHPSVEKVFGAYTGEAGRNYTALQRRPDAPGGIVTIKLRGPVAEFYDQVQLAKGPSFGTVFTILCPFLYLAHYNLVSTEEGRRHLTACNLDPDLLRISVGTEEIDRILAAFSEAL